MRTLYAFTVLFVLALSPITSLAQKQYNTWYFGAAGNGLDFSTDPPTILTDGETQTTEGTAVYSDPLTGDLLFYTDGMTVWDRQHAIMPNGQGLISNTSSTQSSLIVPDPGNEHRFYIFHNDQAHTVSQGLFYSICDLQANNGFGDITDKNISLLPNSTEKLTAIARCDSQSYWIIAHQRHTDTFFVWLLDASGVSSQPIRSSVGEDHGPHYGAAVGYLAASPDGSMLAAAIYDGWVEIFRFDVSTGIVSDPIRLPATGSPYGVSFSPDNSKVYASTSDSLIQYDVTAWDPQLIAMTEYRIPHPYYHSGMRLGPDQKLYLQFSSFLGVVAKPNLPGAACEFTYNAIDLPGENGYGLPNNIDAFDQHYCRPPEANIRVHATNLCEESCLDFTDSSKGGERYRWTFVGATPSSSIERNPRNICYSTAGTYTIRLIVSNTTGSDTTTSTIRIKECIKPEIALRDTTICKSDCLIFRDTSSVSTTTHWFFDGASPSAYTGKTPPTICYNKAGRYRVLVIAMNDYGSDTAIAYVTVADCDPPEPEIIPEITLRDTTICISECLTFKDTSSVSTRTEWLFTEGTPSSYSGKTPPQICYYREGRYPVRVIASNQYGSDTAFAFVTVANCDLPIAGFTHDTLICVNHTLTLTDKTRNTVSSWEWAFEGATPSTSSERNPKNILYSETGTYVIRLIATNENGSDTAYSTVRVADCDPPIAVLSSYEICEGDCIYLEDSSTNYPTSWEWQMEGVTPNRHTSSKPGRICYDSPGRFGIRLISSNPYGADTVHSNVLVRPATGYATASLALSEPIKACEWVDTAFWVYGGCKDNILSELRSDDSHILFDATTATVKANDSLRVPVRIMPGAPGNFTARIDFSLNGEDMGVSCSYIVQPDVEDFALSATDVEFITKHCDALTRELTITNEACSEQEIRRIYLDPQLTPFTIQYDAALLTLTPEGVLRVSVTYDPTQAGEINPRLVIETAKGNQHAIALRGVRQPLPELSLGLRSATHDAVAGDKVGAELAFETAIGDTALPSVVQATFSYNTDLLSIDEIIPQNGWSLSSQNESNGTLTLIFNRQQSTPIALGEILAQLTFNTYLAREDSTAVALASVICDPHNTQFAECVLAASHAGSGSVHVGSLCGDEHMRRVLGKEQAMTMIVRPNPVTSSAEKLNIDLTSRFVDETIPYTLELIDLMGRSIELHEGRLSGSHESLELILPSDIHGSCMLLLRSDKEMLSHPLMIR